MMTAHSSPTDDAVMERRFRITVRGSLTPEFGFAFGEVETREARNTSVLSGRLVDGAFLDGILAHLRDLGMELLGVETWEAPIERAAMAPGEGELT